MGPKAGEHVGHMGPRAGGFYVSLAPIAIISWSDGMFWPVMPSVTGCSTCAAMRTR